MYKNILIPIDLNDKESIEVVLPTVHKFVDMLHENDLQVHFMHTIPTFGLEGLEEYLPRNWKKDKKKEYTELFNNVIRKQFTKDTCINFHITSGAVYDKIINYSEEIESDLIILSAVSSQSKDYMLGPNASKVARHSSVSVLVVRD